MAKAADGGWPPRSEAAHHRSGQVSDSQAGKQHESSNDSQGLSHVHPSTRTDYRKQAMAGLLLPSAPKRHGMEFICRETQGTGLRAGGKRRAIVAALPGIRCTRPGMHAAGSMSSSHGGRCAAPRHLRLLERSRRGGDQFPSHESTNASIENNKIPRCRTKAKPLSDGAKPGSGAGRDPPRRRSGGRAGGVRSPGGGSAHGRCR